MGKASVQLTLPGNLVEDSTTYPAKSMRFNGPEDSGLSVTVFSAKTTMNASRYIRDTYLAPKGSEKIIFGSSETYPHMRDGQRYNDGYVAITSGIERFGMDRLVTATKIGDSVVGVVVEQPSSRGNCIVGGTGGFGTIPGKIVESFRATAAAK